MQIAAFRNEPEIVGAADEPVGRHDSLRQQITHLRPTHSAVDPSNFTRVVDNLLPNTCYFEPLSFTSAGIKSEHSGEAVRTVN